MIIISILEIIMIIISILQIILEIIIISIITIIIIDRESHPSNNDHYYCARDYPNNH